MGKRRNVGGSTEPCKMYCAAVFTGFQRGKTTQNVNKALLRIEGVRSKDEAKWYLGKRCVFIYKGEKSSNNTKFRTNWGKIVKCHGQAGGVRAKFNTNLPSSAMGSTVRVMLYPQH